MKPTHLLLLLLIACKSDPSKSGTTPCDTAAILALRSCVTAVSDAHGACLASGDSLCAADDPTTSTALDDLRSTVLSTCSTDDLLDRSAADYAERLVFACEQNAEMLVGRVAGGPHAAVWANADADTRECLESARDALTGMVEIAVVDYSVCLGQPGCTESTVNDARDGVENVTTIEINADCPNLGDWLPTSAAELVARSAQQADCLAITARPEAAELGAHCGPSEVDFDAPRGEWTQVVFEGGEHGTRCGDGSDYAFWIRPAPEGYPLDNVLIGLEGGGVCVFNDDCAARKAAYPELFSALDNTPPEGVGGIASTTGDDSAFANWTHVFLPYCTQDVHAGGGVDEDLGSLVVSRYGAVNARAAVTQVRDWMWREIDNDPSRPEGYRPDNVHALFGGWSAGSYGTLYNYAWMLDELGWPHTTAFPDAGLALDNGEPLGVRALGALKIPEWGTLPLLPPYCFEGDCAVGTIIAEALSPRLLREPEQQLLMLTNQIDDIHAGDSYFSSREGFLNAVRAAYCDTRDLPGIAWYLTGAPESTHVVTIRDELWSGTVDGVVMADWFAEATSGGAPVSSHADEGEFVSLVPGTEPFPCSL